MADGKKKKSGKKTGPDWSWILFIFVITMVISAAMSFISSRLLGNAGMAVSFLILICIVAIGIVFDIIGVAVTACPAEAAAECEPREFVLQRRHRRYLRCHFRFGCGGHRGAGRAWHGEHEGDDRDARDERAGRGRDRRREGRGKDVCDGWERAGRAVDCKGALLFPHHFSE